MAKEKLKIIEPKKAKLAISTSVLFDMTEADALWRAETRKEVPQDTYRRFMMDNMDKPLHPHSYMFDIVKQHIESGVYDIILMSKNSAMTGMRAIKSMIKEGIVPNQFVFTNGASIAEYCRLYNVDTFFTTNEKDAEKADAEGIATAIYTHPHNLDNINIEDLVKSLGATVTPLHTKPHLVRKNDTKNGAAEAKENFSKVNKRLNYAFDFDKVLAGPESDDFFARSGFNIEAYRNHELEKLHIEMQKAPWFRQYERIMGEHRASHLAHINTARGAEAAIRMFYTLGMWGIEPNGEIHCMSGMDKTSILKEQERRYGKSLFLDDGQKNVDRALDAGIPTGRVPSGSPTSYLGA